MIAIGLNIEEVWLPVISGLTQKGFRIATLIEATPGFDPDIPGKDSYRHRKAGAEKVLLLSDHFAAKVGEGNFSFAYLLNELKNADIVLIKGFLEEDFFKIGLDIPADAGAITELIIQKAKNACS